MRLEPDGRQRGSALAAGFNYFAWVFAFGLLFGLIRVFLLLALMVPLNAVLTELPFMLVISWIFSRRAVARYGIPTEMQARFIMGAFAFFLLMLSEIGLSALFGTPPEEHWAHYETSAGLVGLLGQIVFGLIPMIQARHRPREF